MADPTAETKHDDSSPTLPKGKRLNVRDDLAHLEPEAIKDLYAASIADEVQVICLNLSGDINIGSIMRSASLFGVGKVHLLGRRRYDKRGAVGQHAYVPTEFHTAMVGAHSETLDVPAAVAMLEVISKDHPLVVIEQCEDAKPLATLETSLASHSSTKAPIFLVGNEGSGIDPDLLTLLLKWPHVLPIFIPQRGVGRSHNVSNALSMVLWEYYRSRT